MIEYLAFLIFPLSIIGLILSANYLLEHAKQIGVAVGASPFVVGLFIVALGTSFPEAATALVSTYQGLLEVPIAQTIGSNIVNILLALGISSIIAGKLIISKSLIDQELPILTATTIIFIFVIIDGTISFAEGFFLLTGLGAYLAYIFNSQENRNYPANTADVIRNARGVPFSIMMFCLSSTAVVFSSIVVIDSLVLVTKILGVPEALIAVTILALGTSLPEIVISIQAVVKKDIELAIGNVIGSNIFNILFVVGLPAILIAPLTIDLTNNVIQLAALVGATLLFVISGISNRISRWEGIFFVLLYVLFVLQISGII